MRAPIIQSVEDCKAGECIPNCTQHKWSIPFTTPHGLVCECYNCHKTKFIKVE